MKDVNIDTVRENLKRFINVPVQTQIGKVLEVDEANLSITIDPFGDEVELVDVRLKAGVDEVLNGVYEIPAVGSDVLYGIIGNDEDTAYVVKCSEVSKVIIKFGDNKLIVSGSGFIFNDGSLGGLIKIEALKSELDKVNSVLNAMLTILQGAPIPEPGSGAPSALQTALATALTGSTLPDYATIEDESIKH